jgi:hypothetical protein
VDIRARYGPVERLADFGLETPLRNASVGRRGGHLIHTPELEPGGHGRVLIDRRVPDVDGDSLT